MPDIAMCNNKTCPASSYCYRFTATPSMRQSYMHFQLDANRRCDSFKQDNRMPEWKWPDKED